MQTHCQSRSARKKKLPLTVSCAWLLREIETAGANFKKSRQKNSEGWDEWQLPVAKSDATGRGAKRTLACACPSPFCPVAELRRVYHKANRSRRTHGYEGGQEGRTDMRKQEVVMLSMHGSACPDHGRGGFAKCTAPQTGVVAADVKTTQDQFTRHLTATLKGFQPHASWTEEWISCKSAEERGMGDPQQSTAIHVSVRESPVRNLSRHPHQVGMVRKMREEISESESSGGARAE